MLRTLGPAEIPILASRHSNFEGPRTTFKIEAVVHDLVVAPVSSMTESGYMAKSLAALPVSGLVILGS